MAAGQGVTGKVVYVSDGDTFHMQLDQGGKLKIRVADIDCPESTQSYGLEAKEFVVNAIKDTKVTLRIVSTDRYGRKIARVFYQGKDLSEELIKNGLAWHYVHYSKDPKLASLEREAREAGLNIWSEKKPIPPWEYRRNK